MAEGTNYWFWVSVILAAMVVLSFANTDTMTGRMTKLQTSLSQEESNYNSVKSSLDTCTNSLGAKASSLQSCEAAKQSCEADEKSCQQSLTYCNDNTEGCVENLRDCSDRIVECNNNLGSCNSEKFNLNSQLTACNNLLNQKTTYFDVMAQNYANLKCCGILHDYKYYYVSSGSNIVCTDTATTYTKPVQC